ncbi:ABC transporter permease [Salicibibacter cibarius]|uniref:ABC transporter permease n=1 Tax=Salicibibacter cibarius TaxID=2743000 RepID=A0A7T7CD70_9BACI|nr:ABC transporter permease [Salicibibacter cibarius]QQK77673.1 ABC transporter permease [Salicibibacter cibarius]
MFETVYIESLKIKRSKLILLILVCTAVNACLSYVMTQNASTDPITMGALLQGTITNFNLLLGAPLFAIVTAFIVTNDYRHHIVDQLFTYPISRAKILWSKMFLIFLLILLGAISLFLFTVGIGVAAGVSSPNELYNYIFLYVVAAGMQMALAPIIIMISIAGRNMIGGIAVAVIAGFSSGLVTSLGLGAYYPWSIPTLVTYDILGILDADIAKALISLFIVFVVPLVLSFILYKKDG